MRITHARFMETAFTAALFTVAAICLVPSAPAHEPPASAGGASPSFIPTDYPVPFGGSPTKAWLDPWPHSHFSRRGTPFVHLFNLEPAFLDRDLFFDYQQTRGAEEDESELEVELEWALTRRLGIVVEGPLVQINPEEGDTEAGLGDVAIAPRALLVDTDRFLLSANLELSFPTGDAGGGLGGAEAGLAPSISAWLDLGQWFTLHTQFGTEHGLESGDSELFYSAALTYSFLTPPLLGGHGDAHAGHAHFPPGLTNLIVEVSGRTGMSGEDDGSSTAKILFGASYNLDKTWEIRGGYILPVGGKRDIDDGLVLSLIYHF